MASWTKLTRPLFLDMKHSNNAARVRLWLRHNPQVSVESKTITYGDLTTPEYAKICPTRKSPAFLFPNGDSLYESAVILNYLEDEYNRNLKFCPESAKDRARMHLLIRLHDLYVASPNSTMPGMSHTQGAMYLSPVPTRFCPPARCMDRPTRAKKIQELWHQLQTLEDLMDYENAYLIGSKLSLADFTWFPTTIFMEFMLPRVFQWPNLFHDEHQQYLPKFTRWWQFLLEQEQFALVHQEIFEYWQEQWENGQFDPIHPEVQDCHYQWSFPVQWDSPLRTRLHYQDPPPPGKRTGRYIQPNGDERDVLSDQHVLQEVMVDNARNMQPPASLERNGFELVQWPSELLQAPTKQHFLADPNAKETYYQEMRDLVYQRTGCSRVYIFDHTLRESSAVGLNAVDEQSLAATVHRVHCDYTATGAPRRFLQLAPSLGLSNEEAENVVNHRRFAFINIWRSIDTEHPVVQHPLAVCDTASVPDADQFLYELHFPDRVGENYSLRYNPDHAWYHYPRMTAGECLVFKVFDTETSDARFVFHTAVHDPRGGFKAPPRRSVETRAIAVW